MRSVQTLFVVYLALVLSGCADRPRDIGVNVQAKANGAPLAGAQIFIDGHLAGTSGTEGIFTTTISRKPDAHVVISVAKDMPGYHTNQWSESFVIDKGKDASDNHTFVAEITALPVITFVAHQGKQPIGDALVTIAGKSVGSTDESGELHYAFPSVPTGALHVRVVKKGYFTWEKDLEVTPGGRIEATLDRRYVLRVKALAEEFGTAQGLKGVSVFLGRKHIGNTDANGEFTMAHKGLANGHATLVLAAPGHIPEKWQTPVKLNGDVALTHYFYNNTTRPVRLALYRFAANTAGENIGEVPAEFQAALAEWLSRSGGFKRVSPDVLVKGLKAAHLSLDQAVSKGWHGTKLAREVDVIAVGSIAKDNSGGFTLEVKFYAADGHALMSELATARDATKVKRAAREIAVKVREGFPVEGVVTAVERDNIAVSIDVLGFGIDKNSEFSLLTPKHDRNGRVTGYRDVGGLKIKQAIKGRVVALADGVADGDTVPVGAKVVRRPRLEFAPDFVTLAVNGEGNDSGPVSGVNVYINDRWVSATDGDGQARVPVRLNKSYRLTLYRHGYSQLNTKLKAKASGERQAFSLDAYATLFKIASQPAGATVYVDDQALGTTPIVDGVAVRPGFHTVRLSLGGEYRDWQEVMDFGDGERDLTGTGQVTLYKDFIKLGEAAEAKGDIDAALQAYASADDKHPDYAEARQRAGRLLMDEKKDYDGAIGELERLVAIPEVQQLVYKQYAVAYVNLGYAYHEKANAVINTDKDGATKYLAKAIQALQTAKTNARFFPTENYDQAVHDTYFYLALSYHKLYQLTHKAGLLDQAELAWRDYLDFFPASLEQQATYRQSREAAGQYLAQLRPEG